MFGVMVGEKFKRSNRTQHIVSVLVRRLFSYIFFFFLEQFACAIYTIIIYGFGSWGGLYHTHPMNLHITIRG